MEDKLFESVKNRSYFNKAVDWYCNKYLFCVTERSWLVLIVTSLLVCLCVSLLNIYLLFPIEKDFNFVRYSSHTDDEFSVMHKLSLNKKENEYTSVASYLIKKYIELYESYKIVEPSYQENFVKNNSIHKIYKNFQEKMSNEVSSSHIYERKVINTNIIKLSIDRSTMDLVTFTGNANVIFTTEQNKKVQDQTVEISFTLSNIQATLSGIIPFKFIVSNYQLQPAKAGG
ncbi:MAG: conjugal transfer protein TraJ [Wolbachia sp.]|nr:conjugal transfer protein TraJ [Wolbachia sp.]MDD9336072.1 conjugal transfer protein TraJ [Wolbachia sp.]